MPRPHKCRRIACEPGARLFKPAGVPACRMETVELRLDELEALRLADLEGLYQDAAAERMGVSRATFGRLLADARHKVAAALLGPHALEIKGGHIAMTGKRRFQCNDCGHVFEVPFGGGRPAGCPQCASTNFCRADAGGMDGRCRRRQGGMRGGRGGGQCRRRGHSPAETPTTTATQQTANQRNEEDQP